MRSLCLVEDVLMTVAHRARKLSSVVLKGTALVTCAKVAWPKVSKLNDGVR